MFARTKLRWYVYTYTTYKKTGESHKGWPFTRVPVFQQGWPLDTGSKSVQPNSQTLVKQYVTHLSNILVTNLLTKVLIEKLLGQGSGEHGCSHEDPVL